MFLSLSHRLGAVMCLGVTAGAYILTLFAVSCPPWHGTHVLLVSDFQVDSWGLTDLTVTLDDR